jgi:altronate dehydratase
MNIRKVLFLPFLLFAACAQVNYIGQSYESTNDIQIYYDEYAIEESFTIIGHAVGTGTFGASNDKIRDKLIKAAKHHGADAILITGLGKSNVPLGDDGGSTEETQVMASFVKYDSPKRASK